MAVDVVVVGGGVAGSSAAIVLRGMGLGVLLVERSPTFRDRVRGEGIHPWGVAEAERVGVVVRRPAAVAGIEPVTGVLDVSWSSAALRHRSGQAPGWREDRGGDHRVTLEDGESISCRLVVAADGARSLTRRLAGIATLADPSAGGFRLIFARGPEGFVADGAARARFFGEPANVSIGAGGVS